MGIEKIERPVLELSAREVKEIGFSQVYQQDYNHGTAGHVHYLLIAKLAFYVGELLRHIDSLEYIGDEEQ